MPFLFHSEEVAKFLVKGLRLLIDTRVVSSFQGRISGKKSLQNTSSGFEMTGHTVKQSQPIIGMMKTWISE